MQQQKQKQKQKPSLSSPSSQPQQYQYQSQSKPLDAKLKSAERQKQKQKQRQRQRQRQRQKNTSYEYDYQYENGNNNSRSRNILKSYEKIQEKINMENGFQTKMKYKNVGYVVGDPIVVDTGRPTTPKMGGQDRSGQSKNTSRLLIGSPIQTTKLNSAGQPLIIHQHPSRPVRSTSPISHNPKADIVPTMNFIYNSSGKVTGPPVPPVPLVAVPLPNQNIYSRSRITTTAITPPKVSTPIISKVIDTTILSPSTPILPSNLPSIPANMVPRSQYQRCVSQCRNWQQRYNQLYSTYLTLKSTPPYPSPSSISPQEHQYLQSQNIKLKQQVRTLERNQQKIVSNFQDVLSRLIGKYRDSTLKECMLLTDRYRLERKMEK